MSFLLFHELRQQWRAVTNRTLICVSCVVCECLCLSLAVAVDEQLKLCRSFRSMTKQFIFISVSFFSQSRLCWRMCDCKTDGVRVQSPIQPDVVTIIAVARQSHDWCRTRDNFQFIYKTKCKSKYSSFNSEFIVRFSKSVCVAAPGRLVCRYRRPTTTGYGNVHCFFRNFHSFAFELNLKLVIVIGAILRTHRQCKQLLGNGTTYQCTHLHRRYRRSERAKLNKIILNCIFQFHFTRRLPLNVTF